jgi:GAF domain-containing protein
MASDPYNRGVQGQRSISDEDSAPGGDRLARQLSEIARELHQEDTLQDTLLGIVRAAVDNVPGAQFAGISVVEARRKVSTRAWTDEVVRACDHAQYETGQGPCLDSIYEEQTFRLSDMGVEQRWPEFTKRAVEMRIGSMLSFQLYVSGDNLGALNLYNSSPEAFSDQSEHVGLLLASHAAVAMARAQHEEHLLHAMASRDLIGQAKGILMERYKITANQAFSLLIRASQDTNSKLHVVADHLIATTGQTSS